MAPDGFHYSTPHRRARCGRCFGQRLVRDALLLFPESGSHIRKIERPSQESPQPDSVNAQAAAGGECTESLFKYPLSRPQSDSVRRFWIESLQEDIDQGDYKTPDAQKKMGNFVAILQMG